MEQTKSVSGMITDVLSRRIFGGTIHISEGKINRIEEDGRQYDEYILPGFTDAHIHIESSMVTPYEFARAALIHGTVATISDPHEIANVCGMEGIRFMIENAKGAGLKFHFGAPSCVPATEFESAGAVLGPDEVKTLLADSDIWYLSEMMNYPGVLFDDAAVLAKIKAAKAVGKPVDGHAPGLRGEQVIKYASAGITTDHECFTLEEALDKLKAGMKILIREGSAARNFDALVPLLKDHWRNCMFCCDDKHPDELVHGHINMHVKKAISLGFDLMDVLHCACVNPVLHYKTKTGLLRTGDAADFIVTGNLKDFSVRKTIIDGKLLAENGTCYLPARTVHPVNRFRTTAKKPAEFALKNTGSSMQVIRAIDGQLITQSFIYPVKENENAVSNTTDDVLKMTVVNRYADVKPACAFVNGFGIKEGAFASSVAHDSHNIIAVGTSDDYLCEAVNAVIAHKGGLSVVNANGMLTLPLPVAGLMSDLDAKTVAGLYSELDREVKTMGCGLRAPYMTLSFMALLVIPQLKLSDKGLFDGNKFEFTPLFTSSRKGNN